MGGIYGCAYQEVGVVIMYRCCCKEVYRFLHMTYPYSTCKKNFQQHPYFFVHF